MNKQTILLSFMLVVLLVFFTGCSNTPEESTSSSDPSSGEESSFGEQSPVGTDPSSPVSSDDKGDEAGHLNTMDWLNQDVYAISYTMELKYPDFTYILKVVMAADGNNQVFQSEGDIPMVGYLKTRIIEKDGYIYYVDDTNKTYTKDYIGVDEYAMEDEMIPNFSTIGEPVKTGEETFNGFACTYEDYETETGAMRFYFGLNKELVGIKGGVQTQDATLANDMYGGMVMLVEYLGPDIPAKIFDIPSEYKLLG